MKRLIFTAHAQTALRERKLEEAWIERTVRKPEWSEPEPDDRTVERRFAALPEREDRVLRVACRESTTEIEVITAFLDRRAKRPT